MAIPIGAVADVPMTLEKRPRHVSRGRITWIAVKYLILIAVTVVFAFPFYWVVLTSLVPTNHVYDFPPSLWPMWDFKNYADAWNAVQWGRYFVNTLFIALATTVLVAITSTLAGYAFASMRFRGKAILFGLVFASIIMPAVVAIIPDYVIGNLLGWLNTYTIQIVPFGASTFGIFLLQQFFRGLPVELYDAARLDGASRLRFLFSIGVPLSWPVQATIALFTFLGSYNALLWPLVMTSSNGINPGVQPIEVGVYTFVSDNGSAFNLLCAATVFTMLPVVILFLFLQRTFIAGVMRTGLKG